MGFFRRCPGDLSYHYSIFYQRLSLWTLLIIYLSLKKDFRHAIQSLSHLKSRRKFFLQKADPVSFMKFCLQNRNQERDPEEEFVYNFLFIPQGYKFSHNSFFPGISLPARIPPKFEGLSCPCRLPLSLFHLRKYITGSRPSNKNWVSTFRGFSWTLRAIFLVCLSLGYMDGVKKIGPGNLRPPLANRREGLMPPSPEPPTQQKKKRKNLSFPVLPIDWKYL